MLPTAFYSRQLDLCESMDWTRWSGYYAPQSYQLHHENEYHSIRTAAGLIDISPLFKITITGPDSLTLLNRIVVRDLSKLKENRVAYVVWCDPDGFVLGDGVVMRQDADTYFFMCHDPTFGWLQKHATHLNVSIRDETELLAGLSLQGPHSAKILSHAGVKNLSGLKYFGATHTNINGTPTWISRSGFTGDLGYELWFPSNQALNVWDTLMESGSEYALRAAGLKALDVCRIEAGLLQHGVDFQNASHVLVRSQKSTPYDLGLDWMVHLDRDPFVGQAELRNLQKSRYTMVGLDIDWIQTRDLYESRGLPPALPVEAWSMSVPLYRDHARQHQVGYATSGTWSPILKRYIALATIETSYASDSVRIELAVEHARQCVDARIVEPRFYDPPHKRAPVG